MLFCLAFNADMYYPIDILSEVGMATIIKKVKKGKTYYYAAVSKRVGGKPRIVWQKYLGTAEALIKRAEATSPPAPAQAVISEAGGVAALLRIAQRLQLREIIDRTVPKREQGPSVGHYIVLAALNRVLGPTSKHAIGDWYEQTILARLWPFKKGAFSSQRFWDHMGRISAEDIEEMQKQLVPVIRKEFGVQAPLLLYDTTNFFTFFASTNTRSALAQRGRNKQKRHDLRQVGLAMAVSEDFQIPLFHQLYTGNVNDVTLFPELVSRLQQRCAAIAQTGPPPTLVFDRGNVSATTMEYLALSRTPFVVALPWSQCPAARKIPPDQLASVAGMPGTRAYSMTQEMWGRPCRLVVTYTESFFTQQCHGVTHHLVRCQQKLLDLSRLLQKWHQGHGRGKKPTAERVAKQVATILSAQFMKQLIRVRVETDPHTGVPALQYEVDHSALEDLTRQRLGRTVLVSSQEDWDSARIIAAYRSLSLIEDAFKNMKHVDYLRWQPAWHWTDQKIRVHGFYCVLGLLLAMLVRKVAGEGGVQSSLPALLGELQGIREVAVIYPPGSLAHRKNHVTLSRLSTRQKKLFRLLELHHILGDQG